MVKISQYTLALNLRDKKSKPGFLISEDKLSDRQR